jgi:CRP-like cAMP-binding protein
MVRDPKWDWAYLPEGEIYIFKGDEGNYMYLKRVGNLTFLQEVDDGKEREEEDRHTIPAVDPFAGEEQGEGC